MENRQNAGTGNGGTHSKVGSGFSSALDSLGPEVNQQINGLRTRAEEAVDQAGEFIRTRPGTSLLIAAAAGYIIGRIVRS